MNNETKTLIEMIHHMIVFEKDNGKNPDTMAVDAMISAVKMNLVSLWPADSQQAFHQLSQRFTIAD